MFFGDIYLVPVVKLAREVNAHDVPTHRSHLVSHLKVFMFVLDIELQGHLFTSGRKLCLPLIDSTGSIETLPDSSNIEQGKYSMIYCL